MDNGREQSFLSRKIAMTLPKNVQNQLKMTPKQLKSTQNGSKSAKNAQNRVGNPEFSRKLHETELGSSVFLFVFSKPKHFEHQISKSLVITVFLTARRRRENVSLFERFSTDFTFQNGTKIWNFLISEPKILGFSISKPKHFRFSKSKT